jgi:hypothetical protein
MEGLGDHDRVDRGVGERNRLGGSLDRLGAGRAVGELIPHLGQWLDPDHAPEPADEVASQLASARRHVDDDRLRPEIERPDERVDRRRRISRAPALVLIRRLAERFCEAGVVQPSRKFASRRLPSGVSTDSGWN